MRLPGAFCKSQNRDRPLHMDGSALPALGLALAHLPSSAPHPPLKTLNASTPLTTGLQGEGGSSLRGLNFFFFFRTHYANFKTPGVGGAAKAERLARLLRGG